MLLSHQYDSYLYLSDTSYVLRRRTDLVFPASFFYYKSLMKRDVHTHQKRRKDWHETSFLDIVSLWLWKPISLLFAQHSFSFRGQNHIESSCMTAGHFAGNEQNTCTLMSFLRVKLSNIQANVHIWEVVFGNVPVYQQTCWVTHVLPYGKET